VVIVIPVSYLTVSWMDRYIYFSLVLIYEYALTIISHRAENEVNKIVLSNHSRRRKELFVLTPLSMTLSVKELDNQRLPHSFRGELNYEDLWRTGRHGTLTLITMLT
jgi:hypothetical protein